MPLKGSAETIPADSDPGFSVLGFYWHNYLQATYRVLTQFGLLDSFDHLTKVQVPPKNIPAHIFLRLLHIIPGTSLMSRKLRGPWIKKPYLMLASHFLYPFFSSDRGSFSFLGWMSTDVPFLQAHFLFTPPWSSQGPWSQLYSIQYPIIQGGAKAGSQL